MRVRYDDVGRIYDTPDGEFYSVTSFLSAISDKSELNEWSKRVGKAEAERIANLGKESGEKFHLACEEYLLTGAIQTEIDNFVVARCFKNVVPLLDKHITQLHASELAMWSKRLQLAGRVDCVVDWDGELSIIDFKLLKTIYPNRPEYYHNYFLQLLCYAQMWWEMFGVRPRQAVLLMVERFSGKPVPLIIDPWENIHDLIEKVKHFRTLMMHQPQTRTSWQGKK